MDLEIFRIFTQTTQLLLIGLVAGALFFFMAGLRELSVRDLQGMLFLVIGAFFLTAHFLYLGSVSIPASDSSMGFSLWNWLEVYVAPSLIALFILFGTGLVIVMSYRAGMYHLFFGLTLFCYLYMIGSTWPMDVKGLMTLAYSGAWIDLGLRSASS